MKKIGICSLYYKNYNYGGLLQSYAMVHTIKKLGYDSEQISIANWEGSVRQRIVELLYKGEITPKRIFSVLHRKIFGGKNLDNNHKREKEFEKRKNKFRDFEHMIPHSETVYNLSTIGNSVNQYDIFVCGSDQIWNWNLGIPHIYALKFVPKSKNKIAYAASIANMNIPKKSLKRLSKSVSRLNSISVREKSAIDVFPSKLQKRIKVVLDPTLLLEANEWRGLASHCKINEPYIFCYFLGTDMSSRRAAQAISNALGIKIVTNPHIKNKYEECDKDFGDIKLYDAGPMEFLWLIDNAELVLTDSFHACAFSLQFQKDFYVFERKADDLRNSMHSRIKDFLETFGLTERLIISEKDVDEHSFHIDYEPANDILNRERQKSIDFLRTALME